MTDPWEYAMLGALGGGGVGALGGGPLGALVGATGGGIAGAVHGFSQEPAYETEYGYVPPSGTEHLWADDLAGLGNEGRQWAEGKIGELQRRGPTSGMTMMEQAARGEVPSAAEMQQRQGLDRALSNILAARASGRGGRVGAADRLAQEAGHRTRLDVMGQTAALRAQEQQQARGSLLQAQLQNQAMIDQQVQYYTSLGYNIDDANRQSRIDVAEMQSGVAMGNEQLRTQREGALIGSVGTGLSSVSQAVPALVASDVRAKKNISKADKKVEGLLDALEVYEFDYRDDVHGGKKNIGVMAQDLEKSDAGKQLVVDGPVKMVDLKRALMASMAAGANLHKRLKVVEGR